MFFKYWYLQMKNNGINVLTVQNYTLSLYVPQPHCIIHQWRQYEDILHCFSTYNCDCDFKMTCFNLAILYKQCKIFFTYICKPFKSCNSMTFINQFTSFWKIHSSLKESARGNFWRFSIFCSCYLFLFVSMMLAIVYFPILI